MLFRLSPLSLEGSLILNEVNFLCGWMKTPHVAPSGLWGGAVPTAATHLVSSHGFLAMVQRGQGEQCRARRVRSGIAPASR